MWHSLRHLIRPQSALLALPWASSIPWGAQLSMTVVPPVRDTVLLWHNLRQPSPSWHSPKTLTCARSPRPLPGRTPSAPAAPGGKGSGARGGEAGVRQRRPYVDFNVRLGAVAPRQGSAQHTSAVPRVVPTWSMFLSEARRIMISSFSILTYSGSLYLQKNTWRRDGHGRCLRTSKRAHMRYHAAAWRQVRVARSLKCQNTFSN